MLITTYLVTFILYLVKYESVLMFNDFTLCFVKSYITVYVCGIYGIVCIYVKLRFFSCRDSEGTLLRYGRLEFGFGDPQ